MQLGLPLVGPPGGINGPPRWQRALVTRDDGTIEDPTTEAAWAAWVAAGGAHNWCAGRTLVDWLDLYAEQHGFAADERLAGYDERFDFARRLRRHGLLFEERVLAYLERRHRVTRIAGESARSLEAAVETADALARGDPIVARGVLRDPQSRAYGRVDLLVRDDVLVGEWPDVAAAEPAPLPLPIAPLRHHRVVEIKYKTLPLLKDGALAGSERATMLQVFAYNRALGRLQGYEPPAAYVLGRTWQREGRDAERGRTAWERLGRVDMERAFKGETLADLFDAYAGWARRVRDHGGSWSVLPVPSVDELWPGTGAGDAGWHEALRRIGDELRDLTQLWQVGRPGQRRAHALGLTRWDDPRIGPELLGVREAHRPTLAAMLAVNRDRDEPAVRPARITRIDPAWREPAACEAYVDFETIGNLRDDFARFPERGGQSLIFQIGCGRLVDGRWTFAQFTARSLAVAAEAEMLDAWLAHLAELARSAGVALADVRLFHWSPAETSVLTQAYDSARRRHPERSWPDLGWFDLLERVIRGEPVVARGALAFGLKQIGKAFHALGLIQTEWTDGVADGTGAMAGAWWAADETERIGANLMDSDAMREVGRYNEIDCRVMAEVLGYLRREH